MLINISQIASDAFSKLLLEFTAHCSNILTSVHYSTKRNSEENNSLIAKFIEHTLQVGRNFNKNIAKRIFNIICTPYMLNLKST